MFDFKKYTKVAFILSIFLSFIALMANWLYLNKLGRLDLFLDSIASKDSLLVISFFIIIFLLAILLIFIYPTIHIMLFLIKDDDCILDYNSIRLIYIRNFFFVMTAINALLVFFSFSPKSYAYIHLVFLVILIVCWYYLCVKMTITIIESNLKFKNSHVIKKKRCWFYFLLPTVFLLIILFYSFPFLVVAKGITLDVDCKIVAAIYLFSIFEVIIIFSIFPCHYYFSDEVKKDRLSKTYRSLSCLLLSFSIFPLFLPSVPLSILNATMNFTGIKNNSVYTYILDGKEYPDELFDTYLWGKRRINNSDKYTIDGISVYSFGNVNLICPQRVATAYTESLEYHIGSESENLHVNDNLKNLAQDCISFDKNKIKTVNKRKVELRYPIDLISYHDVYI